MKRILLPTDFSENSLNAIHYAIQAFAHEECRFIIVNAYMSPQAGASMLISLNDVLGEQSLKDLENLKRELENKYFSAVIDIDIVSEYGYVPVVIESVARKNGCDLIVMGTKGATGLKGMIIGSNTSASIKNTHYPLLAIPEEAKYTGMKKIALAWDERPSSQNQQLDVLTWLCKSHSADLLVVNVDTDEDSKHEENQLAKPIAQLEYSLHFVPGKNVAEGLEQFVKENNVDVVAAIPHEHGFFERLFKPSVTKQLCLHTEVPLLIIPEEHGASGKKEDLQGFRHTQAS